MNKLSRAALHLIVGCYGDVSLTLLLYYKLSWHALCLVLCQTKVLLIVFAMPLYA